VQLADAAGRQVHVDACDLLGNREVLGRQLARPSSILDPFGRDVEGGPEEGLCADLGGQRILKKRKLALDRIVVRAVAAQAFRVASVFIRPSGGKSGLPNVGVGWFGTARAIFL
jgi:hypothetical protein